MKTRVFVNGLVAAVVSLCLMAAAASAATYTVTTTTDSNDGGCTASLCSLRDAVNAVDAGTGGDTIVVPAGTYPIDSGAGFGALSVTQNVTIQGGGASSTVLDGGNATEILFLDNVTASISGLTLQHGNSGAGVRGGAIFNHGNLTLTSDVLSNNTSTGAGGAIENQGTLSVLDSTLSDNSSTDYGGAINNEGFLGAQQLTITNSTLMGNQTGNAGGGAISVSETSGIPSVSINRSLFTGNSTSSSGAGGAIWVSDAPTSPMQITNSTFTANQASGNGGAISDTGGGTFTNDTFDGNSATNAGGNIDSSTSPVPTLENTIIAGGTASFGANCDQPVTSGGHNLEDADTCGLSAANHDLTNTDPKLGSLADNGGPTQTMALQPGSPAIDAGTNSGCPSTDQRGVTRPQGSACDIGAYEVAPPSASTGSATGVSPTGATLNTTATNPDAVAATVTFQYGTTTSYGSTVTESAAAFSGQTAFSATLSSLQPNTTYHYRVVVTNPDGTSTGADRTFTTPRPSNQFSVKGRHVSRKGTITIKLGAPDAGGFKGKATFKAHHKKFVYGAGSKSAGGAGTVTLKIKLRRHARKELLKLGHATVSVVIKFTPQGGTSRSKTIKLKIKVKHGHFS